MLPLPEEQPKLASPPCPFGTMKQANELARAFSSSGENGASMMRLREIPNSKGAKDAC